MAVAPVLGSCATTGSWLVEAATAGTVTQLGSVIDPVDVQVWLAPAMPGTMASDATAKLEPTISRLAHILIAPSSRRGTAPAFSVRAPHHDGGLQLVCSSCRAPVGVGNDLPDESHFSPLRVVISARRGVFPAQAGTSWPNVLHRPNASMMTKAATIATTTGTRQALPGRAIGDGMYQVGSNPGA